MKVHRSITIDRLEPIISECTFGLATTGLCVECGEDQEGCEPDAERYECESCGAKAVYGAEQLLIMNAFHNLEEEDNGSA